MNRTKLIIREIKNYFYLRKVISREMRSPDSRWKRLNLRVNWYYRIYTVISLRDQDMGEEEVVRNWKAMEMMRPFNEYLESLDLQEIIFPSIESIPESRSYLVIYSPLFRELTLSWILWRFLFLVLGIVTFFIIIKTI